MADNSGKDKSVLPWPGRLFAKLFLGPRLDRATANWFAARRTTGNPIPELETVALAAAVIRRVLRVGIIYAALALVPTSLFVWQIMVMKDQTALMQKQNEALVEQLRLMGDQNKNLGEQLSQQVKANKSSEVSDYLRMLLDPDSPSFWVAVSYFSGISENDEITKQLHNRLARMLVEGRGKASCAALKALAVLAPQIPVPPHHFPHTMGRQSPVLIRDVQGVLRSFVGGPINDTITVEDIDCDNLVLSKVDLSKIRFRRGKLRNSTFDENKFEPLWFASTDLSGSTFFNNIGRIRFDRSNLSKGSLSDTAFSFEGGTTLGLELHWSDLATEINTVGAAISKATLMFAICMERFAARACARYHRSGSAQPEGDPQGEPEANRLLSQCPKTLSGGIVSVESDIARCESTFPESKRPRTSVVTSSGK